MNLEHGREGHESVNLRYYYRAIFLTFFISRVIFYLLGIRFDASTLGNFWQYIDPVLLHNNLIESLYYLHSQPPLFNLFLGIMLKAGGGYYPMLLQVSFVGTGLILYLSLFQLQVELGIGKRIAFILATAFIISPSAILYENFLLYTYSVAATLILCGLFIAGYFRTRRKIDLIMFFGLGAILVLTRSMFHLIWIIGALVVVICYDRYNLKRILLCTSVPLMLCLALFVKNEVLFDTFSSSSWLGMNLSKLTTWQMPIEERIRLVKENNLSKTALIYPFETIPPYIRRGIIKLPPEYGVDVLDRAFKSNGGRNLNHAAYPEIERFYFGDATWVIRNRPAVYLRGIAEAFNTFFIPSSAYSWLRSNLDKIRAYDRLWNKYVYGQIDYYSEYDHSKEWGNIGVFILIWYITVIGYTIISLFRKGHSIKRIKPTLVYLVFVIGYIMLIGNLFELGENNRFRILTDPTMVVLTGVIFTELVKKLKMHKGERAGREIRPPFIHPLAAEAPAEPSGSAGR